MPNVVPLKISFSGLKRLDNRPSPVEESELQR